MEHNKRLLLTDDAVRRLLHYAGGSRDPRAILIVVLLLWLRLSIGHQYRLTWSHWDQANKTLSISNGKIERSAVHLTPLAARLLGRVHRTRNLFIFARPSPSSPTITFLFAQLLAQANLSDYTAADFITWSDRQTPATRLSTASA